MRDVDYYKGREQTYAKHFFLERYLERVAYNIGSFAGRFVYVDGFSGPWRSEGDDYQDTSFFIALDQLRKVKDSLHERGRSFEFRVALVEKNATAYRELAEAVSKISDVDILPLKGEFADNIQAIQDFAGNDFMLTFIDPTGWTGFGLNVITPLLQRRPGEVIINFMFNHINRFIDGDREDLSAGFDHLFGSPEWREVLASEYRREPRLIDFYCAQIRKHGQFEYVTSTRILTPLKERTYFYLVYGTRHPKGLVEFRVAERKLVGEQDNARLAAKLQHKEQRTGQTDMFAGTSTSGSLTFGDEKKVRRKEARERLLQILHSATRVSYDAALGHVLELPLIWESDLKDLILQLRDESVLVIENMKARQQRPQSGHFLRAVK